MAKKFLGVVDFLAGLLLGGSAGTSGQVLTSQGAGNAPIWAAAGGTYSDFFETVYNISQVSAPNVGKARWYPPSNAAGNSTLDVTVVAGVAPAINDLVFDMLVNGSVVESGITLSVGDNINTPVGTVNALTMDDYITFNLTQGDPVADFVSLRVRYA